VKKRKDVFGRTMRGLEQLSVTVSGRGSPELARLRVLHVGFRIHGPYSAGFKLSGNIGDNAKLRQTVPALYWQYDARHGIIPAHEFGTATQGRGACVVQ
jgi:hypothetical protein